jgi:hypothetical protein
VAFDNRCRESWNLNGIDGCHRFADEVGGLGPSGAQSQGDIVLGNAGFFGDYSSRLFGYIEGIGLCII